MNRRHFCCITRRKVVFKVRSQLIQGGKFFSKLDLSQAYQQLPLDPDSKMFTIINTHKGLFQFNRLPLGILTAPSIFQCLIENILQGLPYICVHIDNILVSGNSEADHMQKLEQVLSRLQSDGTTLKRSKCTFATTSVEYLGHIIGSTGLHPSPAKVQAIQKGPASTNIIELRAFLGLIIYFTNFCQTYHLHCLHFIYCYVKLPSGIGLRANKLLLTKLKTYNQLRC